MGVFFLFEEEIFHAGLLGMLQQAFDVDHTLTEFDALFSVLVHVFQMPEVETGPDSWLKY